MVDDDELGVLDADERGDLLHLAGTEQRCRTRFSHRHHEGRRDVQPDRLGEADGLGEARLAAARRRSAGHGGRMRFAAQRKDRHRARPRAIGALPRIEDGLLRSAPIPGLQSGLAYLFAFRLEKLDRM